MGDDMADELSVAGGVSKRLGFCEYHSRGCVAVVVLLTGFMTQKRGVGYSR